MNHPLQALMRDAARLTRAGQLGAATAAIQRALHGVAVDAAPARTSVPGAALREAWRGTPSELAGAVLDGCVVEVADPPCARSADQGEFVRGSHTHAALTRAYKLFVPPDSVGRALPLVVMLHGCTQDPDDFALGTGMNTAAREQGFYVLYPAQAQEANPSRCWNWFKHNHQSRDRGETAVIAAMTQAVMEARGIDPDRVYIAGLSAGGAMASLVAAACPDMIAAVGVHSGLPPGAARNLPEALAAMRGGAGAQPLPVGKASPVVFPMNPAGPAVLSVPAIVFHGDQDQTVHPDNGHQVIAAALRGSADADALPRVEQGVSRGGQRYTRTTYGVGPEPATAEHWLVHGAGHAWAGGQTSGSYTDARGPDATREMLRFFFSHPRRTDDLGETG